MTKNFELPTQRFTHTVQHYIKYRPHYPRAVIKLLEKKCGLSNDSVIADIGSGTGIFTKLLLEHSNKVYGIEPNKEMRLAGEKYLKGFSNFISVDGTAENTTLPDHHVDIITSAQAFHWFNLSSTKQEMARILRPAGWVLLVWNLRDNSNAIMKEYGAFLIDYGTDYKKAAAEKIAESEIRQFLSPAEVNIEIFLNTQELDWEGFKGRILSCSYIPKASAPNYQPMLDAAHALFQKHAINKKITFLYETKCYFAQLLSR